MRSNFREGSNCKANPKRCKNCIPSRVAKSAHPCIESISHLAKVFWPVHMSHHEILKADQSHGGAMVNFLNNFLNNVAPLIGTKNRGRAHRGNKISAECRAFSFSYRTGKSKMYFVENLIRRKFVLSKCFYYFGSSESERIRRKIYTINTKNRSCKSKKQRGPHLKLKGFLKTENVKNWRWLLKGV